MKKTFALKITRGLALATLAFSFVAASQANPDRSCPTADWGGRNSQLLGFTNINRAFPTDFSQNDSPTTPTPDCLFHQFSWEAFVWATAPTNGEPRFMTLPTLDDLIKPGKLAGKSGHRQLKLAARSTKAHGTPGYLEGAGAIVEADGNIMIASNGYPVYASVHMNESYFATAKSNLVENGGYTNQPPNSYFSVGAAIFKATWLRLDPGQQPPAGAFTTKAQVPILAATTNTSVTLVPNPNGGSNVATITTVTIAPVPGKFVNVTVALVGMHVVGYTDNHPEFIWGLFEHYLNAPAVPDNTFTNTASNSTNFTFYKANTSYSVVNQPSLPLGTAPPALKFNPATQKFSPVTQTVLVNQTGGESFSTNGPANIEAINASAHQTFFFITKPQVVFSNYNLVGTVWLTANTYTPTNTAVAFTNSLQNLAVGSVNLANSTAETFQQVPPNPAPTSCFLCHNSSSYGFSPAPGYPALTNRLIAISHVLGVGTGYAVSNLITGTVTNGIYVNRAQKQNRQ